MSNANLPPHDNEAEEAVIATALVDPKRIPVLMTIVQSGDFFREKNAWAWDAITSVARRDGNEGVNQITVAHELERTGKLEGVGGVAYLSRLATDLPTPVGSEHYARIVRRDSTYRQMISAASKIARVAYEGGPDERVALGQAMTLVQDVAKRGMQHGPVSLKELLTEWFEAPPIHKAGVLTGWPRLNTLLGSLRPGSVYVVAARPSRGKSSFTISLLRDVVVTAGKKALLFSLEMSRDQIVTRLVACEARVDSRRVESKTVLTDEEHLRVNKALGVLGDTDQWIQDRVLSIEEIEVEAKAHALRYGVDLVCIDYLQLASVAGNLSRYATVTEVSRRVKQLAMQMGVPIVLLSQLSRQAESRTDQRPILSDLRESGGIEQDADVVAFLHDGLKHVETKPHDVQVLVDKHRMGATGVVRLRFEPALGRFSEPWDAYAEGEE